MLDQRDFSSGTTGPRTSTAPTSAADLPPGFDWVAEEAHWRDVHESTAWYRPGRHYEDYRLAYELGWNQRAQSEAHFDEHEDRLAAQWETQRGESPLGWPEARAACRAAWQRADRLHFDRARQVERDEAPAFAAQSGGAAGPAPLPTVARPVEVPGDDEVVGVLNHLLENARDGEQGYHAFVQEVESAELKRVFEERAAQHREAARELLPLIARHGGTPAEGGSVLGALHRGWVHLKGAFGGDGAESMLSECERAEEASIDRYRSALQHRLPDDVRSLIDRQSVETRQQHERMKLLREDAHARS